MSNKLYLENQLCFPFYAISRNIIKRYTPFLKKIKLTYPQYLVMLILWKKDNQCVTNICKKLWLETNTISPLLKNLEKKEFIIRKKNEKNNKKIDIFLTRKGKNLKKQAELIPEKMLNGIKLDYNLVKKLRGDLILFMKKLEK